MFIKNLKIILLLISAISLPILGMQHNTNFMYINKTVTEDKFVFPKIRKKINWDVDVVEWMTQWLSGNPQGQFVFWYDSKMVTQEQINSTKDLFAELTSSLLDGGHLLLRDINELTVVQDNPQFFTEEIPIYLRLDLLRIITLLEYVEKCRDTCASIYADIDKGIDNTDNKLNRNDNGTLKTKDLSKNGLFDQKTMENLKRNGLLMRTGFENSFLMVSNHKPNMLKALRTVVIDSNFKRILLLSKAEKELRAQLPTNALRNAPLDKNFSQIDGFDKLDEETKTKLRQIGKNSINIIWDSMTSGSLLVYFKYLEQELDLFVNEDIFGTKEKVDFAEVFSQVDLNDRMEVPFTQPQNQLLLKYAPRSGITGDKDNDYNVIFDLLYLYGAMPVKDIGGSFSQSYSLGW